MAAGDAGCDTGDHSRRHALLLGLLRESAGSATCPETRRSSVRIKRVQFDVAGVLTHVLLCFAQWRRFEIRHKRERTMAEYFQGE